MTFVELHDSRIILLRLSLLSNVAFSSRQNVPADIWAFVSRFWRLYVTNDARAARASVIYTRICRQRVSAAPSLNTALFPPLAIAILFPLRVILT